MEHYGSRLATRVTRSVDQRLRLYALLQRKPLQHVVDQLLGSALPTADELRRQLSGEQGSATR